MLHLFLDFRKDKDGATVIEYALIAGLISIAIIGGATATGSKVKVIWQIILDAFSSS